MLRRIQAATAFPSCGGARYRNRLCRRSLLSNPLSISIHHQQRQICRFPLDAQRSSRLIHPASSTVWNSVRSLSTLSRTSHENHVEDMNKTVTEGGKSNDTVSVLYFPEGASLNHEEWLDTTTTTTTTSSEQEDLHAGQRLLIMERVQKEIPFLIQDYLSTSSSLSGSSRDSTIGHDNRRRHGKMSSLAARYREELKWIRRRRKRVRLELDTLPQDQGEVATTEEHSDNEYVEHPSTNEHVTQDNRLSEFSSSTQKVAGREGDDDDDVDKEEDLAPLDSYLAEASQTNDAASLIINPSIAMQSNDNTTSAAVTATTPTVASLESCLALLHAMSRKDWAVVDGESLLLGDDDDDDDESSEGADQSATVTSELLPSDQSSEDHSEKTELFPTFQEDDDDDVDDIDVVDDELFWTLRQLKLGGLVLDSTDDYNLILARVALAAELDHDDILEALLDTLHQIKAASTATNKTQSPSPSPYENGGPNATTYEILLLVMNKRLQSFRAASDLVRCDMSSSPVASPLLTTATLEAAMVVCETNGDLSLARELWSAVRPKSSVDTGNGYEHKDGDEVRISNRVYHSMLNMFKAVDARDEAIETLRIALQENGRQVNKGLDRVFVNAIKWPNRNRKGEPIDNLPVLVSILDILDDESMFYAPGITVLTQLLISVAKGAQPKDHARWKVVQRIFQKVSSSFPAFHVDNTILNIGLEAGEAVQDPTLAVELITRLFASEFGSRSSGSMATGVPYSTPRQPLVPSVSLYDRNQANWFDHHHQQDDPAKGARLILSSKSLLKAMDICVNCGDAVSARRILDCVEAHYQAAQIPKAIRQRLYVSTLKVCASMGEGQVAEQLLSVMLASDLEPTEEAFGAVILGYTIANSSDKAIGLLNDMQLGRFGEDVTPGPASYNAIILDRIQNKAWPDALERYDEMKQGGVMPMASTYVGLLLACCKVRGRNGVISLVNELVETKAKVNSEVCAMAVRLAMPELAKSADFDEMRARLRSMSDEDPLFAAGLLDLNRALRLAELEEQRGPSKGLSQVQVSERRDKALHAVLKRLLALFRNEDDDETCS